MIEVKNLTFSYGKDKQALHGLDFTVEDGEIFGFLGPNASGKSTTQKILTGILKGHSGKVSLFRQDISNLHGPEFFQKIGVLFEFPYLYTNLSAVENLEYFSSFYPKEQRRDVGELLDTLGFKLDFLKKPVSSYSKGMRKRVSMARALVSNPRLLFLNEPTSSLDPTGTEVENRPWYRLFSPWRIWTPSCSPMSMVWGLDASDKEVRVVLYRGAERVDRQRAGYAMFILRPSASRTLEVLGTNMPE